MDNYILIDSKTRAPVPLPFHTETADGDPITLRDCTNPSRIVEHPQGLVWWYESPDPTEEMRRWHFRPPQAFGLELITETAFMAERS